MKPSDPISPRGLEVELDLSSPAPLYEQIHEQIRRQIETGRLQPGQVLPSARELTTQLQVAYKTVHRAFAHLAREQYVRRVPRRGTVVLTPPQKGLVGVYCPLDVFTPDSPPLFRYAIAMCEQWFRRREQAFRLYVGGSSGSSTSAGEQDLYRDMKSHNLSSLLLISCLPPVPDTIIKVAKLASQMRIPVASLTRPSGFSVSLTCEFDFDALVCKAIAHLVGRSRSSLAVIVNEAGQLAANSSRELQVRLQRTCAGTASEAKDIIVVAKPCTRMGGYESALQLDFDRIDGLIVTDEFMASGVEQYLLQHNVRVGIDLDVVTQWTAISGVHFVLPFIRYVADCDLWIRTALAMLDSAVGGMLPDEVHEKLLMRRVDEGFSF